MVTQDSDNYFKIVALLVDIACSVIWEYMKQKILGSTSFESFLNTKEVKHKLVHVYEKLECCECESDKIKGERLIAKEQLLVLYKSDETKRIQSHKKYFRGRLTKVCICNYCAKEKIDVKVVDITLANFIIQKLGKGDKGLASWMTQIQDLRNEIFHLSDIKELKDEEFKNKWKIIEGSILGIANLIDKEYAVKTKLRINSIKQLAVIPASMFNDEILCRDYWKMKCAEFQRAQCDEMEEKANALHTKLPGVFTETMKNDCQTAMKEIQKFESFIDKINILTKVFGNQDTLEVLADAQRVEEDLQIVRVPAFLKLNVPSSWNESRILEYLQDIRLRGTSDANIRIMAVSLDDLNMYTKIARSVLNVDSLKIEINKILSGILSEMAIDRTQQADVSVNLTIPEFTRAEMVIKKNKRTSSTIGTAIYDEDIKTIFDNVLAELRRTRKMDQAFKLHEKNIEMNIEDVAEKAEHRSAKYYGKYRTKSAWIEDGTEMNSEDVVEKADTHSAVQDGKTLSKAELLGDSSDMNSEDLVEKDATHSAVQDSKTRSRTEFVEKNNKDGDEKAVTRSSVQDDKTRVKAEIVKNNNEDVLGKADICSAVQDGKTRATSEIFENNNQDVVEKADTRSTVQDDKTKSKAEFVDMLPTEKTNYFKLVALLVDTVCQVIWKYIRENLLGPSSFESFLNLIKEKHKLIHVYETNVCCECLSGFIKGENLISRKQLLLLYKSDDLKQIKKHTTYIGRKIVQTCICKYVAIENINIKVIDITLAYYIICKCGKQELGLDNWMAQIKEVRNEIFHLSDIQEMSDDKFRRKWKMVKGSILGIAKLIDYKFADTTKQKIQQTKTITCIPDYMLKYEILCRDYWRNKCAEFERAQIERFNNKEQAFRIQCPKVDRKSIGQDSQKTMEEIRNCKTTVDNINILIKAFGNEQNMNTFKDTESINKGCKSVHVPVFIHLALPATLNKTKVLENLDEMRLNRTSDMSIKILAVSPEDLNIYSEIASTVFRKVDTLRDELKNTMSGMLAEAPNDPGQTETVVVTLTIPEITESVPFESSFQFDINRRKRIVLQSNSDFGSQDCIITNDQLVFTDYKRSCLLIYNFNGSLDRNIMLSGKPLSISVLNDSEVAVSYNRESIDIISINTGKVKNTIKTSGIIGGISYHNELIYAVINTQNINVIKLTGEIVLSFTLPFESKPRCLSCDTDRLFITDLYTDTLYCCDLNKSVKWTFTNNGMRMPTGVTTDEYGNVYVACYRSNNVIVVSPDGKHHKELLTEKDGLQKTSGIYYDKSNDCLLVCSRENCDAFLFDVKH